MARRCKKSMLAVTGTKEHPKWADPKFWAPIVIVREPGKPTK